MANVGRAGIAALTLLSLFPVLTTAEPRAFGEVEFGSREQTRHGSARP